MLGDLNIAEPQGADRICRPARHRADDPQKLPEGFQRSEFLLEKGFIDVIVDRRELKATVAHAALLMGLPPRAAAVGRPCRSRTG